jgi:hypothetical protein
MACTSATVSASMLLAGWKRRPAQLVYHHQHYLCPSSNTTSTTYMEVNVLIESGAEAVNEGDRTDMQACRVQMGRTCTACLQLLRNHPKENAQHHDQPPHRAA